MLRVALNIELAFSNATGMGRHARSMLIALQGCARDIQFTLFHTKGYTWPPDARLTTMPANVSVVKLPYTRKLLKLGSVTLGRPNLSRELASHNIYHDFSADLLNVPATTRIASLHDISILATPESYTIKDRLVFAATRRELAKADKIITVSEFSKEMIQKAMGIDGRRIAVVYNGVSEHFRPITETTMLDTIRRIHRIMGPFILFYGVANQRKNLTTLIRAFDRLSSSRSGSELLLVLCGTRGVGWKAVQSEIENAVARHKIRCISYLPDEELVALISGASCVVMPSLHEGFGLPVVEAMACGTPVICSNTSAFPEVAGDAALLVSPTNTRALAAAIESVVGDPAFAQQLRAKGFERSRRFSWAESARQLLEVYRSVT